ncbi:MAG: hypothetical protein RL610_1159 [Pseudomonadota bacterium]|jgi:hypothetical protein
MARVKRLLTRRVVCRTDDFLDFRDDSFHHQFQALSQGHLGGPAALAAAAHADEKLAFTDLYERNFPAVVRDGTIDFLVQQLLNNHAKLGIGSSLCAGADRHLQDRRPDGRFQTRPRGAQLLADGHHVFRNVHVGYTGEREQSLAQGTQAVKRMDAAIMAIVPIESERVVASPCAASGRSILRAFWRAASASFIGSALAVATKLHMLAVSSNRLRIRIESSNK